MDNCLAVSCDDNGVATTADLDRYTDKIENVLKDEKGRKFFRKFMSSEKLPMKDGCRTLDFWEHVEKLLNNKENTHGGSHREYLIKVDQLMKDAEKIHYLDFATMKSLTIARDSENKEDIAAALKILKVEATKALRGEYNAFRQKHIKL